MGTLSKIIVPEKEKHNVFLVRSPGQCFVGIRKKLNEKSRYSILEKNMLKGRLVSRQDEKESSIFIVSVPSKENWHDDVFASPESTDIFFPYPPRDDNGEEFICPDAFWDELVSVPQKLDTEEKHFRNYTAEILQDHVFRGCTIYDPACSTGEFISAVKEKFPFCRYFASDQSERMVSLTRTKIPDAFVCDIAANENISNYDIIICRFINHEVVKSKVASSILEKITCMLNRKGKVIIFGHTPVALDVPEFARLHDLAVLMCMGYYGDPEGFFQYYILEKN